MALCTQRLAAMHAGGIRVVVIPAWSGSLSSLTEYAATAHALGMSVMWELSNPGWWREPTTSTDMAGYFPAFATACGCDQNGPLLSYLIGWLGALPGTYGYYAADDSMLSAGDRAGVAAYVSQIKQRDPWHTVLIGSFGLGQAQEYEGIADLIGDEIYPVKTTSLLPVSAHRGAWNSVAQTASQAQQAAAVAHRQSAFILQAFTWGDNVDDGTAVGPAPRARATGLLRRTAIPDPGRAAAAAQRDPPSRTPEADPVVVFPRHVRSGRRRHLLDLPNRRAGSVPVGGPVGRDQGPDATGRLAAGRIGPGEVRRRYHPSRRRNTSSVSSVHRAPPRCRVPAACSASSASTASPLRYRRMRASGAPSMCST